MMIFFRKYIEYQKACSAHTLSETLMQLLCNVRLKVDQTALLCIVFCFYIYCTSHLWHIFRLWPANQLLSVRTVHKSQLHMQWRHRLRKGVSSSQHLCIIWSGGGRGEFPERADRKELSFGQSCNETMNNPLENTENKIDPGRLKVNWRFPETKNLFICTQAVFVLLAVIILCRIPCGI